MGCSVSAAQWRSTMADRITNHISGSSGSGIHDLAAPFALDALDQAERATFEAHLSGCADCRTLVAEMRETMADLESQHTVTPPERMRAAVLAEVARSPQQSAGVDQGGTQPGSPVAAAPGSETDAAGDRTGGNVVALPTHRRSWLVTSAAAGIAAVALIAILVGGVFDGTSPADEVLAAADASASTLDSEVVVGAQVTFSPELGRAVFTATELPEIGADQTYELWLIDDDGPAPAGTFTPNPDGGAVALIDGEVTSGLVLGLTVEPAGGSPTPTGEVLLAGPIG